MTSYTTRSSYPYPDPSDQVADYPTNASAIAGYLDHLPNRNAIINPVMDIWQRGTSFSNPATGAYTADRWRIDYDGAGGTRTVARNTISLGTNLPSGIQGKYFMEVILTNAGTATTQSISQRVERVNTFAGETITLSAWVRNDGGGTGVNTLTAKAIQNFGTGGSPSTAVTTTLGTAAVTGTWVRLHVHATLPSISGKTIGSNGDDYLQIMFDLGSQTGKFWLYGVQLEQNTTQTALERRPIQQELALCQRYYYRITATQINTMFGMLYVEATQSTIAVIPLPVTMRTIPSLSSSAASNFLVSTPTAGATGGSIIMRGGGTFGTTNSTNHIGLTVQPSVAGFPVNGAGTLLTNGTIGTFLAFDAEL
jgi:hypothetical protein